MAQDEAPARPRREFQFVDLNTGLLTSEGLSQLDQMWRQVAAGFIVMPCIAATTANLIALTPRLTSEGAQTYGDGMVYSFIADATSTGSVTANVTSQNRTLTTVKVYLADGVTQAAAGNVVAGTLYFLVYASSLDTGNGGFYLK
jgi:hypothetical protein